VNPLLLISLVTAFVAGRPVPVTCAWTPNNWAAYYDTGNDAITLDPTVCARFRSKVLGQRAYALYTLVHESEHAKGLLDEHDADCATLAEFPVVIARFRFPARMSLLGQFLHDRLPPPYSGPCL
jgi:hypothetical protein